MATDGGECEKVLVDFGRAGVEGDAFRGGFRLWEGARK
jgi:hypothetical protein